MYWVTEDRASVPCELSRDVLHGSLTAVKHMCKLSSTYYNIQTVHIFTNITARHLTITMCLQNKARQYLLDYCKRTSDVSSRQRLRSANRYQLIVPRHRRSMFGRRAFSIAGPMEWNSLPDSLRDPARSTDSFRSALKTHLFAALRDD